MWKTEFFSFATQLGALVLFACVVRVVQCNGQPRVKLTQGELQGIELNSRSGRPYNAFLGIPFMPKPERFMPPSFDHPPKWNGIFDASKPGNRCIQHDGVMNRTTGSEDCHFINLYVPKVPGNYSTIVYIHGGGFQWGTGAIHGADYLLDEDIILCTFNYRLGALGFLAGVGGVKGNMGMLDQVAALRWVRDNIKRFGGNGFVTLYGESAGAGSVSLHTLSPLSKGLFHAAIISSGAALNPWSCLKNPKLPANELAEKLNCATKTADTVLECLKNKDVGEIIRKSIELTKWYIDPTVPFGPVVENITGTSSSSPVFLSKPPLDILSSGDFNKVPIIIGVNEDEGIYLHSASILKSTKLTADLNTNWNNIAPITLTYYENETVSDAILDSVSSKIRKFYFQDKPIGEETRQQLTNLYSDRYFNHGVYWVAKLYAKFVPVYNYIITHQGNFSFLQQRGFEKGQGCTHKDELQYIFSGIAPELQPGLDLQFSQKLVKLFAGFASTGVPSLTWGGNWKNWKPVSEAEADGNETIKYYKIDTVTQTVECPFTSRMEFWDELTSEYGSILGPPTNNVYKRKNFKNEL